ncbi:MAG: hypothetical protein HYR90_04805 [Candidatus Andersenbacteria bacterium]|nr:hypothetical protein [Candidatus Andersenbacteria bacterium]
MNKLKKFLMAFIADRSGAIDDFGINFAGKVLRKYYEQALTPAVTNKDYEGEIKEFGDRVRILSFLHDILTATYTAGSDMATQTLFDTNEELVINQQRYYNFAIDKVEELFTQADPSDVRDALVQNSAKEIEKVVDNFTLSTMAGGARAGNWLGQNARVVAGGETTHASIATTATGGTLSVQTAGTNLDASQETPDGTVIFTGFTADDLGKAVRLTSGATWATEWYRITARTDSNVVSIVNWDDSTDGYPIPNGDVLRGLYGGRDFTTDTNGDDKPTVATRGWGWEFQAAIPTTVTSSNIYEHFTMLDEMLNKDLNPIEDRHIIVPFSGKTMLLQASELQPSGIEMLYTDTIVNGRVGRVAGFDVHMTSQGRFSTKVGHSTSTSIDVSAVVVAGTTGYLWPAFHKSFCTFAFKWSETRTVEAENQFAKKYQGLILYGAKVPILRKSAGAVLYAQAV